MPKISYIVFIYFIFFPGFFFFLNNHASSDCPAACEQFRKPFTQDCIPSWVHRCIFILMFGYLYWFIHQTKYFLMRRLQKQRDDGLQAQSNKNWCWLALHFIYTTDDELNWTHIIDEWILISKTFCVVFLHKIDFGEMGFLSLSFIFPLHAAALVPLLPRRSSRLLRSRVAI